MKKSFTILMALVITFFTVPFGGITALAESEDSLKDGTYKIDYTVNHDDVDVDGYFTKPATLKIDNGIQYIQFEHTATNFIVSLSLPNGEVDIINEDEESQSRVVGFEVDGKLSEPVNIGLGMVYGMTHDVQIVFNQDSVIFIEGPEDTDAGTPIEEDEDGSEDDKENGTENSDEPEGENDSENEETLIEDADRTYEIEYVTDSASTERQFHNPVTLLEKDGEKYIQMSGTGGQFIKSLTINGTEVTWGERNTDGTFIIQFELLGSPSEEIDFGMVISPPGRDVMEHTVQLSFGKRIELNKPMIINGGEKILVNNTQVKMPENLPEDVTIAITSAKEEVENQGDLEIAGEVFDFNFENLGENPGSFELVMGYDQGEYPADKYEVDIYYYDEIKEEWVAQGGTVEHGKIAITVNHFSTYGVFAKETEEEPKNPIDSELAPENLDEGVYTLDYTFLEKGTDNVSSMDNFTEGPAYVKVDKDGNQFVAMTLTSAGWIKGFKVNNKDAKVLQENKEKNTRIVEFVLDNLLNKQSGSVSVNVPGVYNTTHDVDLIFDVDSIDVAENNEYPEDKNVEQETESEDPAEENKSEDNSNGEGNNESNENNDQTLIPDKAFEIDYVVKHATEDKPSAADGFFKKPAHLLYIDGEKYIQLTINNWSMIDWLRTEHGGDVIVVQENSDGSALIQFKVPGELSNEILLSMSVTVPGMYEEMLHEARLFLDVDSQKEVNPDEFLILVEGSPKKPDLEDPHSEDKDENTELPVKNNNPQTGDTTSILLYTMLLIGSLIPLAVKLRRRFV